MRQHTDECYSYVLGASVCVTPYSEDTLRCRHAAARWLTEERLTLGHFEVRSCVSAAIALQAHSQQQYMVCEAHRQLPCALPLPAAEQALRNKVVASQAFALVSLKGQTARQFMCAQCVAMSVARSILVPGSCARLMSDLVLYGLLNCQ